MEKNDAVIDAGAELEALALAGLRMQAEAFSLERAKPLPTMASSRRLATVSRIRRNSASFASASGISSSCREARPAEEKFC